MTVRVATEPSDSFGSTGVFGSVAAPINALRAGRLESSGAGAFGARYFGYGSTITERKEREFAFSYGTPPTHGLTFGFGGRYINRSIKVGSYSGIGLDLGGQGVWDVGTKGSARLGIAVTDLGMRLRNSNGKVLDASVSPMIADVEAAYTHLGRATFAAGYSYVDDSRHVAARRSIWAIGGEYWAMENRIALRAGYRTTFLADDLNDGVWALGAGVHAVGGALDYSMRGGASRSTEHILSMAVRWAEAVQPESPKQTMFAEPSETLITVTVRQARFIRSEGSATFHLTRLPDQARFEIVSADGVTVWEYEPRSSEAILEWNGRDRAGNPVAEGFYEWMVAVSERVIRKGVVQLVGNDAPVDTKTSNSLPPSRPPISKIPIRFSVPISTFRLGSAEFRESQSPFIADVSNAYAKRPNSLVLIEPTAVVSTPLTQSRIDAVYRALAGANVPIERLRKQDSPSVEPDDAHAPVQIVLKDESDIPWSAWRIVAGSFRETDRADTLAAQLRTKGYAAKVEAVEIASGRWFRVSVDSISTESEANRIAAAMRQDMGTDPIVRRME
ncbi:MAG: SPOR domain-containing protein [Candidatus Poribacteria bacterium]|nr:SPOR domain-containing protein [Candidatus Poribacteria bacterium]